MEKGYEALHSHPSLAVFREGNLYRNSRQKDANDAVMRYGRLFTVSSILNSIETSSTKIKILAKTRCR